MADALTPDTMFKIMAGVHRCVAAREVGLKGIFAEIQDADGYLIGKKWVPLTDLYTTKASIDRWDRNWDFEDLKRSMGSPVGRASLPVVILEPVSQRIADLLVPLHRVTLTGY